ncbi:hypothetical protein N803_16365 [Knoellia subterranea KCTC 19937]|uniref:Uncharacterized protein n=1 Tax=Knoellia subterranea KCTC 19937 TaxID=1385521 RepID=A0A0A0JJQ4_9MICO|nr:hypothetical protein N803_16365 [Knoellia subterranea KCTC 19937]
MALWLDYPWQVSWTANGAADRDTGVAFRDMLFNEESNPW